MPVVKHVQLSLGMQGDWVPDPRVPHAEQWFVHDPSAHQAAYGTSLPGIRRHAQRGANLGFAFWNFFLPPDTCDVQLVESLDTKPTDAGD